MTKTETKIDLYPGLFTEKEKPFLQAGSLIASVFQYSTGVCAVRFQNEVGALVLLPFQGQQVWRGSGNTDFIVRLRFPNSADQICWP